MKPWNERRRDRALHVRRQTGLDHLQVCDHHACVWSPHRSSLRFLIRKGRRNTHFTSGLVIRNRNLEEQARESFSLVARGIVCCGSTLLAAQAVTDVGENRRGSRAQCHVHGAAEKKAQPTLTMST